VILHGTGSKPVLLLDKGSGKCSRCQWGAGRLEISVYTHCGLLNTQNSHIQNSNSPEAENIWKLKVISDEEQKKK